MDENGVDEGEGGCCGFVGQWRRCRWPFVLATLPLVMAHTPADDALVALLSLSCYEKSFTALFPILADVVKVKTGSGSTAHWSIRFIRLNGWLRHSFAQLITLLDIDGMGQNWEDSNIVSQGHGVFAKALSV